MKTLVVEDDPVQRRILEASLRSAGHDVRVAANGEEAWALINAERIRLVVTDWIMPDIDGPELIRRIRGTDLPGYTYVILLTAKDGLDDIVDGLRGGADDYLTKPFDHRELQARHAIGERIVRLEERLSASHEELRRLAMYDSLTGLFNRRTIKEHAEAELDRVARGSGPLSLALVDIDHFKSINDRHGHLTGDSALRLIGEILAAQVRSYDWASRWGGEEFLAVFPGTNIEEGVGMAERLRAAIAARPLSLPDGSAVEVRASFGVSGIASGTARELDTLLREADAALYRAKREGRDRVCVHGHDTGADDRDRLAS